MNSLKTIAKLATLVVIGGGTIGAAVGITQAQSFHDAPLSADAENSENIAIYLKPSEEWKKGNPWFALYDTYDGQWHTMTKTFDFVNNGGLYKCEVPSSHNKFVFCKMKSESTETSWDNVNRQTHDVFTDIGGNVYKITNETYGKFNGVWEECYYETNCMNIWIQKPEGLGGWNSDNVQTRIAVWGGDAGTSAAPQISSDYNGILRFVVPINIDGFRLFRSNGNVSVNQWQSFDVVLENAKIKNNFIYKISGDFGSFKAEPAAADANTVTAEMMGDVLEPIITCSSDARFGYNAVNDIRTNFYSKMSADEIAKLSDVTFKDVDHDKYYENKKSYEGLENVRDYKADVKWTTLNRVYTENKGQGSLDTNILNNTALVAGSVTILGTSLIAGFAYLLKKRKANA